MRDESCMWTAPDVTRDEFPLDLSERDDLEAFITWHRQTGLDHTFDGGRASWSVRMPYLHLIEEWAPHNGHADRIREAIDGAAGE